MGVSYDACGSITSNTSYDINDIIPPGICYIYNFSGSWVGLFGARGCVRCVTNRSNYIYSEFSMMLWTPGNC